MSEVDDFLAHYGVKGMRWGKRKENRAILRKAGHERLASSGGSAAKANWKSVGKMAAVNAVTNLGGTAIMRLAGNNPNVNAGVMAVGAVLQTVAAAKSINEIRAVNAAVQELEGD